MSKVQHDELQREILALYAREHAALGEAGTNDHLDRGKALSDQHKLGQTLAAGGVALFPHAGVADCGYQIAACVHAALDSGKETVVVISVLHAFTPAMDEARVKVNQGDSPANYPFWGIQGSGIDWRNEWQSDHVLISWHHFWNAEIKRRGLKNPPQLLTRFPYLAGGHPKKLPGIELLARQCENAAIVTTADPFHHGIGYGHKPEEALEWEKGGREAARKSIETGIQLLADGDYWGYNQQCARDKSDARDAGQVFRYIRGAMTGRILDLTVSDASELYRQPPPTWVGAALIEWRKNG